MAGTFFEQKQGPAVLKHAVLERYVRTYFSKTGVRGRPGLYVDGYAGPGTYHDDLPGSPKVATNALKPLRATRNVHMIFIEKVAATFNMLTELCREPGFENAEALHGEVEDHVERVLDCSAGKALLGFFDPFGMGLPMGTLHKILSRSGLGNLRVPTEVLLNFSRPGVYRNAGKLTGRGHDRAYQQAREKTISRMNAYLGGGWWQPIWRENPTEASVDPILQGYKERLANGEWSVYDVPIAPSWQSAPRYHLLLLTQHPDGLWLFNENVSLAMEDFYDWCHQEQLSLESPRDLGPVWERQICTNIERLLGEQGSFTVVSNMRGVFGNTLGYARQKHLRRALRNLEAGGVIADRPSGELQNFLVRPS